MSWNRKNTLVLFLIIWATFFVIYGLFSVQRMSFSQDIARDYILIKQYIDNHHWLVNYGPKASVGNFFLPPLYFQIYLVVIMLFPKWYTAMAWVVIFFTSMTPALLWLLLRKQFLDRPVLPIALAVGYGLFWQVIVFSTSAWSPDFIPLITIIFLISWWNSAQQDAKPYWPVLAWFALIFGISFHYQAGMLIPFAGLMSAYCFVKYPRKRFWIVVSPFLALLTLLPMLVGELQTDFSNTNAIIDFFLTEHSQYFDRVGKVAYLTTFWPAFIERVMLGIETWNFLFGRALFIIGFLSMVLLVVNRKARSWWLFIAIFLISLFISIRFFKGDKLDYYLMTLFPMPTLLIAAFLTLLKNRISIITTIFLLILIPTLVSGFQHGVRPSHHGLDQLKETTTFIEETVSEGKVRFVFHDMNFANLYYFGMTEFTDISIDQENATVLVDVCKLGDSWCMWGERTSSSYLWPIKLEQYNYYKTLHENGYHMRARAQFADTQIIIGTIATPAAQLKNPLNTTNSQTGSDYLIE